MHYKEKERERGEEVAYRRIWWRRKPCFVEANWMKRKVSDSVVFYIMQSCKGWGKVREKVDTPIKAC